MSAGALAGGAASGRPAPEATVAKATVSGIVLAAGAGSRMGRPKAGILIEGVSLLQRAVVLLATGGCDEIVAVVRPGRDSGSVSGARLVPNPDADSGMASSLRVGLDAVTDGACVVILVDQYGITSADIAAVIDSYRAGSRVVVARRGGRRSHPVLFERTVFTALRETLAADEGARAFIDRNPELVTYLELADVVGDLDTPADLAAYEGLGRLRA
jgi:CTP:molybdopterin cytidylyltransferase MocA